MKEKRAVCISACSRTEREECEASRLICRLITKAFEEEGIPCQVLELGRAKPVPCTGCGECREKGRCVRDQDFNRLYGEIRKADYLLFVLSHFVPVPSKLSILFEKMKQDTSVCRLREPEGQGPLAGKLAAVISCEGGQEQKKEKREHRVAVNDILADVLEELKVKVVPFNSRWSTGIFLSEDMLAGEEMGIQRDEMIRTYVEIMVQTSKILHVIL